MAQLWPRAPVEVVEGAARRAIEDGIAFRSGADVDTLAHRSFVAYIRHKRTRYDAILAREGKRAERTWNRPEKRTRSDAEAKARARQAVAAKLGRVLKGWA
jgi:hypothetical protein|tara:strand:- start:147 stop:449 length:303 start_codon:yes stop_codon:yes gene_type:complete